MHSLTYITTISFLFCFVSHGARAVDTATVSITAAAEYAVEPACVQSCVFYNSFGVADYLVGALGCTSTIYNACYCTQIADQSASTALSTCVNTLCRGTTEISNAISLYQSYCSGAGYPRSVLNAQTTASSNAVSQSSSGPPSSTSVVTTPSDTSLPVSTPPPSTMSSSSPSSSISSPSSSQTGSSTTTSISKHKKKSKTGPIVGGVVGGLAVLVLVIGAIFFYLRRRRQSHNDTVPPPIEQLKKVDVSSGSPISNNEKPTVVVGNAELENNTAALAAQADSTHLAEIQGQGLHGLRQQEMDAGGRYIGELHGNGRLGTNAELP